MITFILTFFIIMVLIFLSTTCIYCGLSMSTSHPILGFLIMTIPCSLILAALCTAVVTGG